MRIGWIGFDVEWSSAWTLSSFAVSASRSACDPIVRLRLPVEGIVDALERDVDRTRQLRGEFDMLGQARYRCERLSRPGRTRPNPSRKSMRGPDDDHEVGFLQTLRSGSREGEAVIGRHAAASLPVHEDGDAGSLDELAQSVVGPVRATRWSPRRSPACRLVRSAWRSRRDRHRRSPSCPATSGTSSSVMLNRTSRGKSRKRGPSGGDKASFATAITSLAISSVL